MLAIQIPQDTPNFTQTVTLDGADFVMRFRWNPRGGWFVSIDDASGAALMGSKRLVADMDLLLDVVDARRPLGNLMVIDSSGQGVDPGYADLDRRVVVCYFSPGEIG